MESNNNDGWILSDVTVDATRQHPFERARLGREHDEYGSYASWEKASNAGTKTVSPDVSVAALTE